MSHSKSKCPQHQPACRTGTGKHHSRTLPLELGYVSDHKWPTMASVKVHVGDKVTCLPQGSEIMLHLHTLTEFT
jgi:hypothetical protein